MMPFAEAWRDFNYVTCAIIMIYATINGLLINVLAGIKLKKEFDKVHGVLRKIELLEIKIETLEQQITLSNLMEKKK